MGLTAKNRGSIIGVGLVIFGGLKDTIETGADGVIAVFWLYTP
jgi:hypothetical protein